MADVNSNINISFNTADALAQLRKLQAGLSTFHQTLAEGNLAAANAQKGLNAQLIQSIGATGKFAASQTKVASSTLSFTNALEKNKLSLREYYRYSMAAATANTTLLSKAFAQEREIINRARRDRVKLLQSQYIQLNKANGGFIDALKIMPKSLAMANGRFTELGTRIQYAAQRQQLLNKLLMQGSTNLLNFGKNMQWAGRQLMVGLSIPMMMLGGYASKAFRELEQATVKFRRVYGDAFTNDAQVEAAVQNIKMLAKEYVKYGVAVKDTMDMAATAAAAGFQGKALTQQVNAATKLAVLGQIDQQKALETTISLQNAFGLSADQLAGKIDFLNAVENQTVLSIEDLTTAIPKAAPVIKQLGGSVEDLAFFMTAMKEGGINAAEGANAIKSGLASLINPTKKASDLLAGFGINIKGLVEANKGDIKGIVVGFARALDTLDPLNRARAIEQLFGKFQFARLSTLFQNVAKSGSQASRAFDLAGASVEELAILSQREMKKVQDAVGTKFQAAVEQFKLDIMPLGKAFLEAVTPIVKFFGKLFEKFNNLGDGTKKVITIIAGLVAGLGPVLLMSFGLLANGLANLIKLFATIRGGIAKLNGQTNILGAGFNYVTQEQIDQQASAQALHNTHTKLTEVFNVEKVAAIQLAEAYMQLSSQMRTMAQQNPGLFVGGMGGTVKAVKNLPPIPKVKKFADGIVSVPGPKGAGDVVPAMVSPGEAIIPTKTSEKYRGLITAMFNDQVPGFATGRLPWGNAHPIKQSGATSIGMPMRFAQTTQSREIAARIDAAVKNGRFGKMPPTDFGTLLQPFSGRSFPIRGVGGVYRKPDGSLVVVKPTMDENTALAEVRATQIARDVHGLISPKQEIKTMLDPTDITGQRKLIVLESPYDPRFASMTGKFSKSDMIKQLVASTLRADKDLSQSNVSGRILADVGAAGVFQRASGFRDYADFLPGMREVGLINLLGVKGGAKKFFAQQTSSLAAKMTPEQYQNAILKEIDSALPKLRKLIDKWNLNPVEKKAYESMYQRLEFGKKIDWTKLHAMHVAAGKGVKKLIVGQDPGSTNEQIIKQQVERFNAATYEKMRIESSSQTTRLINDLDNEFIKNLSELEKTNPKRAAIIKAAWEGKNINVDGEDFNFNKSRQSSFHNYLSSLVYKDGKYYSPKDVQGNAIVEKTGRTFEQVKDSFLYRTGLKPRLGSTTFVASGGFGSRFMSASAFDTDVRTVAKGAGGGRQALSPVVRKVADIERAKYLAQTQNVLKTEAAQLLRQAGYDDATIKNYLLRPELSHIAGHGHGERAGAKAMKTGFGLYDSRLVNNFMNASGRHRKILDWNEKQLRLGEKGTPFLTAQQANEYKAAADFMSRKGHPINDEQRALVAKAAELDELSLIARQKGIKVPNVTKSKIEAIKAVRSVLNPNSIFKPSQIMNLSAMESGAVLVKPGELMYDSITGKLTKLTTANTAPKPSGAIPTSGNPLDRRLAVESATRRVVTPTQARALSLRAPMLLPGRDNGDPTSALSKNARGRITNAINQQEKLLQQQNRFTKKEIDRAMKSYRERLVQGEQEKAEAYRKQQLAKTEIRQQQSKILDEKQQRRSAIKQNRIMRQEQVGKYSGGISAVAGTVGMGLMMTGHQGAGMAAMGVSAVAGMAPMFAGMGPVGAAITSIVALGGAALLVKKHFDSMINKQVEYINSTSATTEKMKSIGEITGKVGASELYAKRRSEGAANKYTQLFERGKSQFGTDFLQQGVGKNIKDAFIKDMAAGSEQASKKLSLQLSAYISDGILNTEQAYSIARQIGLDLGNMTLGTKIQGQITDLVGPDGQNLLKDPLSIRVKLITTQENITNAMVKAAEQSTKTGIASTTSINSYAAASALQSQNLTIIQAQRDAQNKMYDDQIRALEVQKAATTDKAKQAELDIKIAEAKSKQSSDDKKMSDLAAQSLNNTLKLYDKSTKGHLFGQIDMNKNAVLKASQTAIRSKYTGDLAPIGEALLSQTKALKSEKLELLINTVVAGGELDAVSATNLLNMFGKNEGQMQASLTTALKLNDPGKVQQLLTILGSFDPNVAKDLFINIATKNPELFDSRMNTLNSLTQLEGKEINLKVFLQDGGKNLDQLSGLLDTIDKKVGKKPVTLKVIQDIQNADPNMPDLSALMADWDKWKDQKPEVQKSVVITYTEIFKTIGKDEIAQYRKSHNLPSMVTDQAIRGMIANELLPNQITTKIPSNTPTNTNNNTSGTKQDPYADLLSRLKNVRNAAINAAGGISELNKALASGNVQSVINKFDGLEQQLSKMGKNQQFIDWITSMDATEQAKWVRTVKKNNVNPFTQKAQKGLVIGQTVLSANAEKISQGFDKAIVGDFNKAQQTSIDNIKNQEVAYRKLVAAGYDNLTIQRILDDQYMTQQIALGKITQQELNTNAELAKQASIRERINALIQSGRDALQQQANIKQIPDVIKFFEEMSKSGMTLSKGALIDLIGDPTQLSGAIAAMNDYRSGAKDAGDRLKEIVNGLNAIKANSDIKIVIDYVQKNLSQKAQTGFEAAQKVMNAKRTIYGNLTAGELASQSVVNPLTKKTTQVGQLAIQKTNAMFTAPGGPGIPNVAGQTLASVQQQRTELAKRMQVVQAKTAQLQQSASAAQDALRSAQDKLQQSIDELNTKYDALIKTQQDKINSIEKQIQTKYTDKIDVLNKENDKLSNDLTVMDHAAQQINDKYDKQVQALQEINQVNQQIIDGQKQQLDLADALTQGDIAAAAKAAQDMRASSASNYADNMSKAIEQSRQNDLAALRGPETGMTKDQIAERQYQISQEIYKLETDPARLELEKQLKDAQSEVTRLEEERTAAIDATTKLQQDSIDKAEALVKSTQAQLDTQNQIQQQLENQDAQLQLQEDYLQSIVDNAIALDDSTGMTLDKWQETTDKLQNIDELAQSYALALSAAADSASAADASWASILATINAIPDSVTTTQIINEIRNITENITRYINTVETGTGANDAAVKAAAEAAAKAKAAAAAGQFGNGADSNYDKKTGYSNNKDSQQAAGQFGNGPDAVADRVASASGGGGNDLFAMSSGGLIPRKYFANGGYSIGTDIVPAMLTPGEFVMSKYAVDSHGIGTMKAINSGNPVGDSVYNYSINVNVKSDANPDDIAKAVMTHIQRVNSQQIRSVKIS